MACRQTRKRKDFRREAWETYAQKAADCRLFPAVRRRPDPAGVGIHPRHPTSQGTGLGQGIGIEQQQVSASRVLRRKIVACGKTEVHGARHHTHRGVIGERTVPSRDALSTTMISARSDSPSLRISA